MSEKYRVELSNKLLEVEKTFENLITLLTSGTIALVLTFNNDFEKIKYANFKLFFVFSLAVLILSLIINLFSHLYTHNLIFNSIKDIDAGKSYEFRYEKAVISNKRIIIINYLTAILFVIGVIFLFLYFIGNINLGV